MRILMIGIDKNVASPTHEVYRRLDAYRRRLGIIDVIVLNKERIVEQQEEGGVIKSAHSSSKIMRMIKAFRIAVELKKKYKYDWITTSDPSELGMLGFLLAHILWCKLQVQIHTDIFSKEYVAASIRHKIQAFLAAFVIKQTTHVRVVSERIKKDCIARGVEEKRVSVVPIAVNVQRIQVIPPAKLEKGFDWYAMFVGRLEKEKNPALALKWFSQMKALRPNGCFIVIGTGSLKEKLKKMVSKMDHEDSVFFKGGLPYDDTIGHIKAASVLLCTSQYEGFGMMLAEAGVCGTPIISRPVGIARELGARIVEGEKISDHISFGAWPKPFVPKDLVYFDEEAYLDAWTKPFTTL